MRNGVNEGAGHVVIQAHILVFQPSTRLTTRLKTLTQEARGEPGDTVTYKAKAF